MTRVLIVLLIYFAGWMSLVQTSQGAQREFPRWVLRLAQDICRVSAPTQKALADVIKAHKLPDGTLEFQRGDAQVLIARYLMANAAQIGIAVRFPATPRAQARVQLNIGARESRNDAFVHTGAGCAFNEARLLLNHKDGRPDRLLIFLAPFKRASQSEALNPPVPPGNDPGGVAIALIDAGLNYTLPLFKDRLARNAQGKILGHDFAEDDDRPYDLDPSRSALFPIHHGTAPASIIVAEAPKARLIPMRYPGRRFDKFADLIAAIAAGPARIASMPLGGHAQDQWKIFKDAAIKNPNILFVVSAGNDGRNIDTRPIYPANFKLENMLVVTSSDVFGRIAQGSNWGPKSVDIAVPGERIDVIDHRGAKTKASGTSYAVPRIAALAARLKARHRDWNVMQLKKAILEFAVPLRRGTGKHTKHGWIPNPALVDEP